MFQPARSSMPPWIQHTMTVFTLKHLNKIKKLVHRVFGEKELEDRHSIRHPTKPWIPANFAFAPSIHASTIVLSGGTLVSLFCANLSRDLASGAGARL